MPTNTPHSPPISAARRADSLVSLQLDDNLVDALPDELASMTRLQSLSLRRNQVMHVPPHILVALVSVQDMRLDENPLHDPVFASASRLAQTQLQPNPNGHKLLHEIQAAYVGPDAGRILRHILRADT